MKVAVSNINIKTHQLFSGQQILDLRVTIVQQKLSGTLKQNCFEKRVDYTCGNNHKVSLKVACVVNIKLFYYRLVLL